MGIVHSIPIYDNLRRCLFMTKIQKNIDYENIPEKLDKHIFFGLDLDPDQVKFRDAIWDPEKLIIFANALAGTGKTLISTAVAELLYRYHKYDGIVYIASPTQEQKQGYLAGSISDKSEPYFQPFYNALTKLNINIQTALRNSIMNQKLGDAYIDCITHTFERGVNYENKVIIIDESQNFYTDELKKVLTRPHDNCKVIVIGHTGQIDLYNNPERSGFARYLEHFRGDPRCAVCELTVNHRGWISSHADSLEME